MWVFSNEIERWEGQPEEGGEVLARSARGELLGAALYSKSALIALRIYSRSPRLFDLEFLRERLAAALERRRAIWLARAPEPLQTLAPAPASESSPAPGASPASACPPSFRQAYRLCFSEGDMLPGLIVDCYGDHVVFQLLTAGLERRCDWVIRALEELLRPACIYERGDSPARALEGLPARTECVRGTLNPSLAVQIDDFTMNVDIAHGQKTGLFLDQIENWREARRYAKGRSVLDVCCYQGGWAISCARGGAAECLGIDSSAEAIAAAQANAEKNGVADRCKFLRSDAFEALRRFEHEERRFGLIVLDPPAFAKNRKQVQDALRGYRELNLRALKILEPGGILITCSCSYHITPDLFDEMLVLAARDAKRILRVLPGTGQALDHPVLLSVPETLYLKARTLEVLE